MNMLMNLAGRFLNGKIGAINQAVAGAIVGWLVSVVSDKLGIVISTEAQNELRLSLMGIGASLASVAVQWYQARNNQKLQATINQALPKWSQIKEDGWTGPKTVAAAERIVRAVPVND